MRNTFAKTESGLERIMRHPSLYVLLSSGEFVDQHGSIIDSFVNAIHPSILAVQRSDCVLKFRPAPISP